MVARKQEAKRSEIIRALKHVHDPEIGMSVWDLGLIYDIKIMKSKVVVTMTLTTPLCPYGDLMIQQVKDAVAAVKNVSHVQIRMTFDPPWKMPDELKMMFNI